TASVSGNGPISVADGNVTISGNADGMFPGIGTGASVAAAITVNSQKQSVRQGRNIRCTHRLRVLDATKKQREFNYSSKFDTTQALIYNSSMNC
ncbi:MAG: hypothetical protein ACPG42_08325, partial [Alphaproteobacteria bacterium]